jgi:hypothetical protein
LNYAALIYRGQNGEHTDFVEQFLIFFYGRTDLRMKVGNFLLGKI